MRRTIIRKIAEARLFERISKNCREDLAGRNCGNFYDLGRELLRTARKRNPHRGTPGHDGGLACRRVSLDAGANQSNLASVRQVAHRRKFPDRPPMVRSKHHFFRRPD